MKLWLDDVRPPPDDTWHWAKTADEAIEALSENSVSCASLDHDLGDAEVIELTAQGDGSLVYRYKDTPRCDITWDEYCDGPSHKERTGYDVVLWMAENNVWPSDSIMVHSWNPAGGERMCKTVDRHGPYETKCPHVPDQRPWTELDE